MKWVTVIMVKDQADSWILHLQFFDCAIYLYTGLNKCGVTHGMSTTDSRDLLCQKSSIMSVPSFYVCNKILIKLFFWLFHYNKESLSDFRFSQWCCKWLKSSGLWHCHWACSSWPFDGSWSHPVHCQAVMNVTAVWSHEASVITCPTTQVSHRRRLEF